MQYGRAVVYGLVTLALLVLGILELLPQKLPDLQVYERFTVTSAPIVADGSLYSTELRGTVRNTTEGRLDVEKLVAVVSDGETRKNVTVDAFSLSRLSGEEIVFSFHDAYDFHTVYELRATVNGEEVVLENRSVNDFPISTAAIFCFVLLIPAALLLVRAVKGCYYLWQEHRVGGKNC